MHRVWTRAPPRIPLLPVLRNQTRDGRGNLPHGIVVRCHTGDTFFVKRLTKSNVEVQTRGEVRYCLPGIGIGVEFVGIRPEAVRAIEREIRSSYQTRAKN